MSNETKKTGPLTVRGFAQSTLDEWTKPEFYGPTKTQEQVGFLGLDPEDRRTLGVVEGQIIQAVRADIGQVDPINIRITLGRKGYAGLTGVARERLGGLVNEKKNSKPQREGDLIEIVRDGDILKISKIVIEKTNNIVDKRRVKIEKTLEDLVKDPTKVSDKRVVEAFKLSLELRDFDLREKTFNALVVKAGSEEILKVMVDALCNGDLTKKEAQRVWVLYNPKDVKACLEQVTGKNSQRARELLKENH